MKRQLSQSTAISCFVCIHFILLMEIMLLFGYYVLLEDELALSWIIHTFNWEKFKFIFKKTNTLIQVSLTSPMRFEISI